MRQYEDIPKNKTSGFSGDIVPDEPRRRDIGAADNEFRKVYAREIEAESVIVSGGSNADTLDGYDSTAFTRKAEDATVTGAWTFNNNIVIGGSYTVDGVDISDHSARHETGGADTINHDSLTGFVGDEHIDHTGVTMTAGNGLSGGGTIASTRTFNVAPGELITGGNAEIDGDKLDIDWTPSNYTPSTSPSEADNLDNLTAHLYGIDQALGGVGADLTDEQFVVMALSGDLSNERKLTAGDGIDLTDGGAGGNATVAVDVTDILGSGLTESSNNIDLNWGTPTIDTIVVGDSPNAGTSTNPARSDHQHGITTSSNPGAAAAILASNSSGRLELEGLGIAATPGDHLNLGTAVQIQWSDVVLSRSAANELQLASGDTFRVQRIEGLASADLTIAPDLDVIFDPAGNDILPNTNYDLNLGSLSKKYLTLHAAELWVETLVAQNTIATIGGRVLVGPTTKYAADLSSSSTNSAEKLSNADFETAGGGGSDVFANWTENAGTGAIAQDSTIYQNGSNSCKLTAGSSADTYVYQNISVSDTDQIILRFWTRGDGTYAGRYRVYDVTHSSNIIATTSTGVTSTTWTKLWIDFDVPSGCSSVRIYFYCPSTNTGIGWFDNSFARTGVQITVEHNEMAEGDIAYSEADGSVEFFEVASAATGAGSYYTYWVWRNLDGTGANDWYAGDALFNTGTVGDGFIDLYSFGGVTSGTTGPTIVGNVRDSDTYNDWTEHWAIGNLKGIYGYGTDTYGVGLGAYSTSGYITIDDTNGLRIIDSNDNAVLQLDMSGNADITNKLRMPGSSSAIAIGTTPPTSSSSGDGIWIDRTGLYSLDSGTYQIKIDATDGILYAGGGYIEIGADGINIEAPAAYSSIRSCIFTNSGGAELGGLYGRNPSGNHSVRVMAEQLAGEDSELFIISDSPTGKGATNQWSVSSNGVYLSGMQIAKDGSDNVTWEFESQGTFEFELLGGSSSSFQIEDSSNNVLFVLDGTDGDVRISEGLYVGGVSTNPATGDVWVANDIRAGSGIYAGATDTAPGDGEVLATAAVSGWFHMGAHDVLAGTGTTVANVNIYSGTISRIITIRSWYQAFYINGFNNGSNYWTIELRETDGTNIATVTTAAMSGSTWSVLSSTGIDRTVSSSDIGLYVRVTGKTGSPAALFWQAPAIFVT